MVRMEIHPRTGGADAQAFAHQLAEAVSRHAGVPVTTQGRLVVLERL